MRDCLALRDLGGGITGLAWVVDGVTVLRLRDERCIPECAWVPRCGGTAPAPEWARQVGQARVLGAPARVLFSTRIIHPRIPL